MTYQIEVNEAAIVEQVNNILNAVVNRELRNKFTVTGDVISSAVKEIIYARKDEIIERVVDRATKEIVRKGLPKLLGRLDGKEGEQDNG